MRGEDDVVEYLEPARSGSEKDLVPLRGNERGDSSGGVNARWGHAGENGIDVASAAATNGKPGGFASDLE